MTAVIIVIVLVLGLVLLFVEAAIVPGFGVAGMLGVLALGAGAVAAWTELGPFWGGVTGAVSIVAAVLMLVWLPRSRAGRHIVLEHNQAHTLSQEDRSGFVGRRGITVTPLRPIGRVRFGSDEIDAMTEGEYVDRNREVEVMTVQGAQVVVRIPDST